MSNCSKNKENGEKSGLSLFKKHHEIYQTMDVTFSHFWVNKKIGGDFLFSSMDRFMEKIWSITQKKYLNKLYISKLILKDSH